MLVGEGPAYVRALSREGAWWLKTLKGDPSWLQYPQDSFFLNMHLFDLLLLLFWLYTVLVAALEVLSNCGVGAPKHVGLVALRQVGSYFPD